MKEKETYKVTIESFDINGYGVCHIDSKIVFVIGAVIDEEVIVEIINVHKKYAFAKLVRILKESPLRVEADCPYYKYCGGCDMMHISYEEECKIKEFRVTQTLRGLDYKLLPIIKADNIYGYRNKVMVPFCKDIDDDILYGFYQKDSHEIVSIDNCLISDELTNKILNYICKYLNIFHISIYDEKSHTGLFKEVMVRHTKLNEYMVVLVTTEYYDFSNLVNYLIEDFKEIKSIYLNINSKKTNVVLSNEYKLIYGNETIIEDILGLKFNVSPASFMQVNNSQCEKLYSKAIKLANLDKNMNVIDAYCGMGSITLNIAKNVNKVYGIEIVESAIENANNNKLLNNINNAEFILGPCEEKIKELSNMTNIDVIFFDPPRKGCDIEFLNTVISMKIPKIIYISCNVATCARDIKILEENGYKLETVVPVDLFPRTLHVETVCLLNRRND
ncbi:MAG: 23S rRNA (uracil(1939)-C(5))-methyltransferase RlmD [Acholeplasmatales bacterium]|nr:23S rRNA (uracil(1939)-C(5))-methyltransferase RlmD [Acholeplasmatales bacterium]